MQRDSLTPIEQAKMYLKRMEMMKGFDKKDFRSNLPYKTSLFIENLSKIYNKSAHTIHNRLQLLYLPEEQENANWIQN